MPQNDSHIHTDRVLPKLRQVTKQLAPSPADWAHLTPHAAWQEWGAPFHLVLALTLEGMKANLAETHDSEMPIRNTPIRAGTNCAFSTLFLAKMSERLSESTLLANFSQLWVRPTRTCWRSKSDLLPAVSVPHSWWMYPWICLSNLKYQKKKNTNHYP